MSENKAKQIFVVELFCKTYEYGTDYYFDINDSTEDRVKQFLIQHCKQHRSLMDIDGVSDDYIEQSINNIKFEDNLNFYAHIDDLWLFVSGEVEDLM